MEIARTLDEYVGLVLAMTRRPAQRRQLKQLKERLVAARETAPLFDTKLLTRHIECTMKMMWEVYAAGVSVCLRLYVCVCVCVCVYVCVCVCSRARACMRASALSSLSLKFVKLIQ